MDDIDHHQLPPADQQEPPQLRLAHVHIHRADRHRRAPAAADTARGAAHIVLPGVPGEGSESPDGGETRVR